LKCPCNITFCGCIPTIPNTSARAGNNFKEAIFGFLFGIYVCEVANFTMFYGEVANFAKLLLFFWHTTVSWGAVPVPSAPLCNRLRTETNIRALSGVEVPYYSKHTLARADNNFKGPIFGF
jgi:hypothetical protein